MKSPGKRKATKITPISGLESVNEKERTSIVLPSLNIKNASHQHSRAEAVCFTEGR